MKIITFNNPHRQKHFDFFKEMNHPHFNVTVNVEVQRYVEFVKDLSVKFTPAMVFAIAKAANAVKEFKWRIRDEQVVEHEWIHPSYTVNSESSPVFSFCTVEFKPKLIYFIEEASKVEAQMQKDPSFEDEPGRDDYLFLSAIPWFYFTSMQHAMQFHPCDSVPRFTFGKYIENNKKLTMPISIQVHHALVNAKEVANFLEFLQSYLNEPDLLKKVE